MAFIFSFFPCSFEGFEMSFFSYIASKGDKRAGNVGTLVGVIVVIGMIYLTLTFLPILVSDTTEYFIKITLGSILLAMGTAFIVMDYPRPKTAFLVALLGIIAEGVEVDIFTVSSWVMTGDEDVALLGGIVGFTWVLLISRLVYFKFSEKNMKKIATILLYIVGFIVLTSGIV
ncbi:hypothetical protein HLB03_02255 [Acidianus sp. DSM 29099]|nr:hypothetical protein [Acidianus sp. RZ1]NON61535.1 hypothetical protein [Acidianus sp. RZ1]